ncbi:MAG: rhomboid family intramembrane serine protease [Rhodocyclaceae bacterium]|nr:rhomboid family intramembrane serine protease [Rhodocyclaceae bacterium]MBX3669285.1 rhomboid family intramembrane serine protease [Rhodocyclaceae bacterium]
MLLIPMADRLDWRKPPIAALLIILVNVCVYFGVQTKDERYQAEALRFYLNSSLPDIEFPAYAAFLDSRSEQAAAASYQAYSVQKPAMAVLVLHHDNGFKARIQSGLVPAGDDRAAGWKRDRAQFEHLMARQFTPVYSFVAAEHRPLTFVTHMFLHGSADHLLGNMVMLFLVAFLVERMLGPLRFALYYLISGVAATTLFWAVHPDDQSLCLGASGAIAGVMAMYVVLLGMRRINFFFFAFVYFDYIRGRAIYLLPLWLANEAWQLYSAGGTTNYLAHIGGFLSGALLAAAHRRDRAQASSAIVTAAERDEAERELQSAIAKAHQLVAQMRMAEARSAFARLVEQRPDDRHLLQSHYNLCKLEPGDDQFHHSALRIMALKQDDAATDELILRTYREYMKLVEPGTRLPRRIATALAMRFARRGLVADAEAALLPLLRRKSDHPGVPPALLALVLACDKRADHERAERHARLLAAFYPDSDAARDAQRMRGKTPAAATHS